MLGLSWVSREGVWRRRLLRVCWADLHLLSVDAIGEPSVLCSTSKARVGTS